MPLRMVATDLDGTIVGPRGISPRTVAALAAVRDAGVHVVFVTGRPPRWLGDVVEATGHTGLALCGNGALVYDVARAEVVTSRTLDAATATEVAQRLRAVLPGVTLALETLDGFRRESAYQTRWDWGVQQQVGPLDELLADDPGVLKLLARHETSRADDLLATARTALDGLARATHSNPHDCLLEVSALHVSKAAALAELAADLGVDRADVVAFGDMPNDVEMLAWAGTGYVMADGHPEAIAAADHMAPACSEDGVAQVVERLLASG